MKVDTIMNVFSFISTKLSKGIVQSLILIVGNFVGTFFSAISLILISRMLGPEKFGEFSVGFAIILILSRINDLGLSNTITKYVSETSDQNKINNIFAYTIKYKFIFSLLIAVCGVLFSSWLQTILNFDNRAIIILSFTVILERNAHKR